MNKKISVSIGNNEMNKHSIGLGKVTSFVILLSLFISGCSKNELQDKNTVNPTALKSIASIYPANLTDSVAVDGTIAVTFQSTVEPSVISSSTLTLKKGTIPVAGTVTVAGSKAIFTPTAELDNDTEYTATIVTHKGDNESEEVSWKFKTDNHHQGNKLMMISTIPLNHATSVTLDIAPSVTFNKALDPETINSKTMVLKQGSTVVDGTVSYTGTTATFLPAMKLAPNTVYTVKIMEGIKDLSNHELDDDFSWSFTTGTGTSTTDVTPPTVISSIPANAATSVSVSVLPSVTFSEAMNATSLSAATFTLKQGTTTIAGTVAYSGTTATFTPASALLAGTSYVGTIGTGAKDVAGNALASNYTWSFTTVAAGDVTAPTILSSVPANAATLVAVAAVPSVTFSEAMNSSTISASTFTLKAGTTTVPGMVAYSGTTAAFTPTSPLASNTVYTVTITTGVKDAAGNALASNYSWTFTTVTVAPVVSFASQVLPVLQNKCMPCHGATNPMAGISITNYTTVSNLSNAQLDNSGMYPKMGVTAAEQTIIKAWIAAGRLNN
jgi:hypothetical protein